jgi:hypothetical protein
MRDWALVGAGEYTRVERAALADRLLDAVETTNHGRAR